jgi:uncharacterized RDD family membrane protein YckC
MQRLVTTLLVALAALAAMALAVWIATATAPSFVGWLDELLTPDGARALPVAILAVLALVAYFVALARRDAAGRSSG